jgi:hypothetical protein
MPMNNRILRPLARPLLLDAVPGAAAAYSLRQLSNAYTGPVVTVRRSSDNAEADFKASEIDDGTLTAFCGAGDGFVKTWHSQTGNNDASQTTAGYQPKIVSSGVLITQDGKPAVDFDGTDDYFDIATPTTLGIDSSSDPHTIVAVFKTDNASGGEFIMSNYSGAAVNVIGFEADSIVNLRAGTASTNVAAAVQDTVQHIGVHLFSGGSAPRTFAGRRDGVPLPTTPADGVFTDSGSFESGQALRLGRWGTLSLYFNGKLQEYIIWPSDLSSQVEQVEGAIAWGYSV